MTHPWFIKSKVGITINRKELPLNDYELNNLIDESQPVNIWQSLMQAAPGGIIKMPADQPDIIKEALLDCMEMLTDQDKYVIDAIIWEQTGYPTLGKRMRCFDTTCLETYSGCVCKSKGAFINALNSKGLYNK